MHRAGRPSKLSERTAHASAHRGREAVLSALTWGVGPRSAHKRACWWKRAPGTRGSCSGLVRACVRVARAKWVCRFMDTRGHRGRVCDRKHGQAQRHHSDDRLRVGENPSAASGHMPWSYCRNVPPRWLGSELFSHGACHPAACMGIYMNMNTHSLTHTHAHSHSHSLTHSLTQTHIYIRIYINTQTHTHTYINIYTDR